MSAKYKAQDAAREIIGKGGRKKKHRNKTSGHVKIVSKISIMDQSCAP